MDTITLLEKATANYEQAHYDLMHCWVVRMKEHIKNGDIDLSRHAAKTAWWLYFSLMNRNSTSEINL